MEARYNPAVVEEKWFKFWKNNDLFVPSEDEKLKPTYTVLMPPPNVTNVLHLGHALNNTLQDVMVRYYRMNGYAAMWKIGVDHAGIATQNVVERELSKEGLTREDLGKEEFIKRVWAWKQEYGSTILKQLQRLGVSGDWSDDRFTMDEVSSQAVKEIFVKLYQDGLIYRGKYIVNWCVHCLTTISDDEVEHIEDQGNLYFVKYYLQNKDFLVVATTRPETISADSALAVHPEDLRYQSYIGQQVKVPGTDRWIPIIQDNLVEPEFGTGVLKVTPFHSQVDFDIAQKHQLAFLEVLDEKGCVTKLVPEYEGLDRFLFRKTFTEILKEQGNLEKIEPHKHSRGTCYRCHHVIEPRLSTQWFVKMESLAIPAKEVVQAKKIKFIPEKWEKVYFHWMDNIKDWSISRQLWWGHPIPAYYCQSCFHTMVELNTPIQCNKCSSQDISPDPDVLDTWFSSWIWPFTVFGASKYTSHHWETESLKRYYPTQYLATAPEIIFFWVARMIMAGMYLKQEVPFTQVFFNSTICDMKGRKMSKSLGNGIDPMDIITQQGADAMRFTLLFISPKGERIRVDDKSFDVGSRLVAKLWNAARYIFSQKPVFLSGEGDSLFVPKEPWEFFIFQRYMYTVKKIEEAIQSCDYYAMSHIVYDFFWHDFCDWFLESQKLALQNADNHEKERLYLFLENLLDGILRLFHPIMPFITEEIWQNLVVKGGFSLIKAEYNLYDRIPKDFLNTSVSNTEEYDRIILLQKLILELRSTRKELHFPEKEPLSIYTGSQESFPPYFLDALKHFANSYLVKTKEEGFLYIILYVASYELYLKLPHSVNVLDEKNRLIQKLQKVESEIQRVHGKLSNQEFLNKGSVEVIETEKQKWLEFKEEKLRLTQFINSLEDNNV